MKRFLRFCTTTLCMLFILCFCFVPANAASKKVSLKAPTGFRCSATGNKTASFRWNTASNAQGYGIFQYDETTDTYKLVGTTKGNSYSQRAFTVKKLKDGKTYKFYIKSYRKSNGKTTWSSPSPVVKVTARKFSAEVKSIHTAYYKVTTKKAVTVTVSSTGKKKKLKKGTELSVTSKTGTNVTGYLKNGTKIKVKRSALKYVGLDITPKAKDDYSKQTKEDFVNSKNYTSTSKYLIWISQYKCRVNIFQGSKGKWKLVRSCPCVIGVWYHRTSSGLRRILKKQMSNRYNGYYPIIHFTAGNGTAQDPQGCAFHYYNAPGMMNKAGTMGAAVSNGCVRLYAEDLLYIYRNCPVGTTVVSI